MSGNRFFIREVAQDLMARLVNIMSDPNHDELKKVETCIREVSLVARFLEKVHRERNRLSATQAEDYQNVKEIVLVYALHYDRLSRFLLGDAGPGDWMREDIFKAGDYTDWKQAYHKASLLFAEYVRGNGKQLFLHQPYSTTKAYAGNV